MPARLPLPRFAPALALLLPLAACGPDRNEFAPPCPAVAMERSLADLVRYRGDRETADLTQLEVQARLVGLNGSCKLTSKSDPTKLRTEVTVSAEVIRGPALPGTTVTLPVFIAVTDGPDRIIGEQDLPVQVLFPQNVDSVTVRTNTAVLTLPVSPEKSGASYKIIAGMRLTPAELAANRKRQAQ